MSRKSLILCLILLAVLIVGTGVAVAFLYSGFDSSKDKSKQMPVESRYLLLRAVPSDAVAVGCFSGVPTVLENAYSQLGLPESFKVERSVISLHYAGSLTPLYVLDMGKLAEMPSDQAVEVIENARQKGYVAEHVNCAAHSLVVMSKSETLVKSSLRHIDKNVSVLDAPDFAKVGAAVSGDDVLFFSNVHAGRLLPSMLTKKYSSYSGFVTRFCDWTAFQLKSDAKALLLNGAGVYEGETDEFMTVLSASLPSVSTIAEVLPSYTLFAASLPMADPQTYINAYGAYLDSRQLLHTNRARQRELAQRTGVTPTDFMNTIGLKEVAVAYFRSGADIKPVLLMKPTADDISLVFKGSDVRSLKGYVPTLHPWQYGSYASSVFGNLFDVGDEACFTYIKGWLVVGSRAVIEEYIEGKVLEYSLAEYMADASNSGFLSAKSSFLSYFSFTADMNGLSDVFRKSFMKELKWLFSASEYSPAVLSVRPDRRGGVILDAKMLHLELSKSKAPVFERDTIVTVPSGPFDVKNSGTGKMNKFYQNSHLSLCLSEGGKDLWGVPFKTPICGTAQNVDYYANGKLQIAFGSGSKLYLIDRLGRYVTGFPVELGKEILIGPDVYDFNGTHKYNIMVLHKDNTVEMYNLKGQKPASWKGIHPSETVKALPERLIVGGSSFWVVRTSIQTLIYPFYGGAPITKFTGDQVIRPDSQVKVVDGTTVQCQCYDGKARTVKLK